MNGAGRIICERYALYFDHTKVTDEQAIDSLRDLLPLLTKILKCVVSVFFVNGDPMLKVSAICLEWDKTASARVVAVRSCLKTPVLAKNCFLTQ